MNLREMKAVKLSVGTHRQIIATKEDGRDVCLCEVYSGSLNNLKDADDMQRLLAAAPDMLRSLCRLVEAVADDDQEEIDDAMREADLLIGHVEG